MAWTTKLLQDESWAPQTCANEGLKGLIELRRDLSTLNDNDKRSWQNYWLSQNLVTQWTGHHSLEIQQT